MFNVGIVSLIGIWNTIITVRKLYIFSQVTYLRRLRNFPVSDFDDQTPALQIILEQRCETVKH